MGTRLSVIIPTCGRASLQRTLQSVRDQTLAEGDEVLLVTDGPQPVAAELFARSGLPGQCVEGPAATRDYGSSQRNFALPIAAGDYLAFMDDDDAFTPGAFAAIRAALREAPNRPHLFCMRYAADGRVLWARRAVAPGNVGTLMIVFPNRPGQLGRWGGEFVNDFHFIRDTLALWPPDSLVWRPEVIAVVRPHERYALDGHALGGPAGEPRRVEDCPYREGARVSGEGQVAVCGLVRQISGVRDESRCTVREDACTACCGLPLPSCGQINPVIASLLFDLTESVLAADGVPGCPAAKAADLQRWAELHLSREDEGLESSGVAARVDRPCCHLGPETGFRLRATAGGHCREAVFACTHPDHRETTLADCRGCRDWSDHPGRAPVPIEQLVPPRAERRGAPVRDWAVGVTTAPRQQPTLGRCLDSLIRAGWPRPRLFVDSAVTVPERHADLPVTLRESRLGAWPNYYLTLAELLMREPHADAYLLVQDDVVVYDRQNLRTYLERCLWPDEPVGAVSLFCSRAYTQSSPGWHRHAGRWVWGAQAFVFPRESAKRFVSDPQVLEHRWSSWNGGLANIDVVIGHWAVRHDLPVYYPCPSLVQHVGDTSTLWPDARIAGDRQADRFAGDLG